mgnify:FL=1
MSVILTTMPVPVAVAIYTASFGLWLLRHGNTRGAVGVFILAICSVAAPLVLLFAGG